MSQIHTGGYIPVGQEQLARAELRPMASVMPPSKSGTEGVIIPKAAMGGIPAGATPHNMSDVVVHIDPHTDQGSEVRLGDLNAALVAAGITAAAGSTPEPTDLESFRTRSAEAMRNISQLTHKQAGVTMQEEAPQAPQQQFTQQPMQQPMQQPTQQPVLRPAADQSRITRPLHTFGRQQPPQTLQPPAVVAPQPPSVKVLFEMEGFGVIESYYHDVVIDNGFVILVFDSRSEGITKYFPQVTQADAQPTLAMQIVGTNEGHKVHTTGIQFMHSHYEYCVLMVSQSWDQPL